jgi:hypothetical protein
MRKKESVDNLISKLLTKVNKEGPVPEYAPHLGPCWVWIPTKIDDGYGVFRINNKYIGAHRASYELMIGPIPEGLELDHLCRVRRCVNPSHLEPVTHKENTLRGEGPSAVHARKTHCIHGHELAGENLYLSPKGTRYCRTCKEMSRDKWRNKRRAAGLRA